MISWVLHTLQQFFVLFSWLCQSLYSQGNLLGLVPQSHPCKHNLPCLSGDSVAQCLIFGNGQNDLVDTLAECTGQLAIVCGYPLLDMIASIYPLREILSADSHQPGHQLRVVTHAPLLARLICIVDLLVVPSTQPRPEL